MHLMMYLVAHDNGAVPNEKEGKGQPDDHIRPERYKVGEEREKMAESFAR